MKTKKIAILGAGNLGEAIAKGIVNGGISKPEHVILTRRNTEKIKAADDDARRASRRLSGAAA